MVLINKSRARILKHLSKKPDYGYNMAKVLRLHPSSVYVLLGELRKDELVEAKEEGEGRKRIMYRLTKKGRELLRFVG